MPLVTDWTQLNFDSYVTVDEAKTIIAGLAGIYETESWRKTDEETKENLLRYATRELADVPFQGVLSEDIIGLVAVWPRSGIVAPNGNAVVDDAIPDFVKRWQSTRVLELAHYLPENSFISGGEIKRQQLVGVGEIEYFQGTTLRGTPTVSGAPSYSEIAWVVAPTQTSGNVSRYLRY